ncbi:helix-turn-helix domain-containing protein [Herbaspirillum sp. RV1423]|uniref:winged helix-turn-helix transcriptional regulator n=1 Tax=Herbaspirillum sp. RV1423 TaxID=1443993 RepID=UPI0004B6AA98|nr:helix-turn-helix domain-containing protein [Herbaspirillum sp. RV1423]
MAKRKSLKSDPCPVARSIDVVGDRWALLIIRDAFDGMRRFGEFQKSLGVAKNILSTRLRDLVEAGILDVAPASDGSAYQEYVLTPKGKELFTVVLGLRQWGEGHLFKKGESCAPMIERETGKPVPKIKLHTCDGKPLKPEDAVVKKKTRA